MPLQNGKAIVKRTLSTTSAAKTNHIDKKGKVMRLLELERTGPVTRVLRMVQKQELGTVAEVEKEIEHESEHEATFEELKELLYGGGEAEREGSAAVDTRLSMRLPLKSSRSCYVEDSRLNEMVVRRWNLLQMALKNSMWLSLLLLDFCHKSLVTAHVLTAAPWKTQKIRMRRLVVPWRATIMYRMISWSSRDIYRANPQLHDSQ
jgi:hypothetical protein